MFAREVAAIRSFFHLEVQKDGLSVEFGVEERSHQTQVRLPFTYDIVFNVREVPIRRGGCEQPLKGRDGVLERYRVQPFLVVQGCNQLAVTAAGWARARRAPRSGGCRRRAIFGRRRASRRPWWRPDWGSRRGRGHGVEVAGDAHAVFLDLTHQPVPKVLR